MDLANSKRENSNDEVCASGVALYECHPDVAARQWANAKAILALVHLMMLRSYTKAGMLWRTQAV